MSRTYRRGAEYVYRHIAGEHLLVALRRREASPLYALTPTSAFVWERLATWSSAEDIAEALAARYDVSLTQARADVDELLEQLVSIRAAEVREDAP